MDISELLAPDSVYVKDCLINWDYVGENLTMLLTSPDQAIRGLAEIYYKYKDDHRHLTHRARELLVFSAPHDREDPIDVIAAYFIINKLIFELRRFEGERDNVNTISQYLQGYVARGVISKFAFDKTSLALSLTFRPQSHFSVFLTLS
jgi:hypothetical protein